jgi:DNA primase
MTSNALMQLLRSLGFSRLVLRGRNIQALCPAHRESRPSWGISVEPPHFHACFSCGFKGTLATLLRDKFGYTRPQILRLIELSDPTWELEDFSDTRNELTEIDYRLLLPFDSAAKVSAACAYLARRRIVRRTAEAAGLYYDPFQKRILFPWRLDGLLLGVTGRAIDGNLVKTLPYFSTKKSQCFYFPGGTIKSSWAQLILCEGETDALWLYQLGYPNVAALGFGTLSLSALSLVMNRTSKLEEVVCFFDRDETGERLTARSVEVLQKSVVVSRANYDFVPLSKTKCDPAEMTPGQVKQALRHRAIYLDMDFT